MLILREDFNEKYQKNLSPEDFNKIYKKTIDFVSLKTFNRLKKMFILYGENLTLIRNDFPNVFENLTLAIEHYLLTFDLEFNALINEKKLISGQSKRLGDWSVSFNGKDAYNKYDKLESELGERHLTYTNLNNPSLLLTLEKIMSRW